MRLIAMLLAAFMATLTPALAETKLTILLDWFVNPDHAALVIAKEGGFFARHGLDVSFIEPADPAMPPRLVAAGQGDIAVTYQPSFYLSRQEGIDLVRVGAAIATPLNTLIVLEDGPIKSLADLKGKSIGYSVSGFEDVMLSAMLAKAGLTVADVKLVNVNFALTEALVSKQVDAVVGGYRNFELTEMKLAGHPGRAFYPEDVGFPAYDELIYVTTPDKAKAPQTRAFLDATEDATLFILNHPAEAWAQFIKAYPKLDDPLNKQAWADTLPRLDHDPAAVDLARYTRMADYLKSKGLLKAVEPVERYVVPVN
ncbi:ABC transporter substrate-binding protein [Lichenihabitans sp. Uapishka_5]|uniref:ABC transporter substrate-binding protein n=1 Tax=Lichenihabitans sp. Uapishka_5 TaxID=3037302 RepID=UPI0029E7E71F|nr:ABC transporter substrate-binding protein [Lichenihabitans sp. Uapishka_5]MDX7950031.1 ABC transporter substrate-binding protein [Lichenihabitans sp. Uapishka_5]